MHRSGLLILLFCALLQQAKGQEEFIEPPSRFITSIPFTQLTGGIVLIQAHLDSFPDTLNFILDTGSSGISLDSMTAEYFNLEPVKTDRTIRGIAVMKKVSFLYNRTLKLPGLDIDSLNFHINDYSILTAVYGEQIDGIIGYSVFSRYILKLNYDSAQVSFWTNGTIKYPRGGYLLKPVFNQLVAQPARVKDARTINTRFLYDMGAGVCMLFNREFVDDSNFLDRRRKVWTKEGEGLGGKIDMELRVIKEVKLGPYRFRKVPVYVFQDEYNVTNYPYMGGLIGNDILRRFNVILNYARGDIHIIPNSQFVQTFDYSYSGVELYLLNGLIVVGDVAKDSPAKEAGVMEGDEVLGVNKNFSQSLNQYKIALQVPNEKIKMIVRRNGVILEFEFKVKSII